LQIIGLKTLIVEESPGKKEILLGISFLEILLLFFFKICNRKTISLINRIFGVISQHALG
jgi:hypothetical protein